VLWYPTQAKTKTRLEWGTQPSLPVKRTSRENQ
jgi:hypothetical protein